MPTVNIPVTTSWTQIATSSNTELLVTWETPVAIEFAATSTAVNPTVTGHILQRDSALTRNTIGSGFVYAKCVESVPATVVLVVSK